MQSEIEMSEKYNDILESFILPKGTQQCFPSQKYCEREIILSASSWVSRLLLKHSLLTIEKGTSVS